MSHGTFGLIAGVAFALLAVALMLPMKFADRTSALAAAFASRFAVGFLASTVQLPMPGWARGLLVRAADHLPDALVNRAYAPILIIGGSGGLLIGMAAARWSV